MSVLLQARLDHDVWMCAQSCQYVFSQGKEIILRPNEIKRLYRELLKDQVTDHIIAYQYALAIVRENHA